MQNYTVMEALEKFPYFHIFLMWGVAVPNIKFQ